MEVYLLVGGSNTRKSSTVRALTGASSATLRARKKVWDLAYGKATHDTFVLTGALQEGSISAAAIVRAVRKSGANRAIFPLRYMAANGFPDAATYIRHFTTVGWTVNLAEMEASMVLPATASTVRRPNASALATNLTAAALRSAWGIA